jgi:DNA-nicking Smr family endonuclease
MSLRQQDRLFTLTAEFESHALSKEFIESCFIQHHCNFCATYQALAAAARRVSDPFAPFRISDRTTDIPFGRPNFLKNRSPCPPPEPAVEEISADNPEYDEEPPGDSSNIKDAPPQDDKDEPTEWESLADFKKQEQSRLNHLATPIQWTTDFHRLHVLGAKQIILREIAGLHPDFHYRLKWITGRGKGSGTGKSVLQGAIPGFVEDTFKFRTVVSEPKGAVWCFIPPLGGTPDWVERLEGYD